jgi:hydrogenase maturation protease
MNLRQQLEACLRGRVCFVGLGNRDYGDDGFGVVLAETLIKVGIPDVFVAGTSPERVMGQLSAGLDNVIFLDAVELGVAAGSVALLNSSEMIARYPQVSTHKISLATLARMIEANGAAKAWVLGVQPESLNNTAQLSPTVEKTVRILQEIVVVARQRAVEPMLAGADK